MLIVTAALTSVHLMDLSLLKPNSHYIFPQIHESA